MENLKLNTRNGAETTLGSEEIEALASSLGGSLVTPRDPGFDEARTIWNGMIDKKPGLIVQCSNPGDVSKTVALARKKDLLISVRGAGHHIAGNCLSDGGLLVDLSAMKQVEIDAKAKTVRVDPGVTLGDLDEATLANGQAVPVGINSTTGISGLTLGGGFGWLSRKLGMTVDSLLSAKVVTATGEEIETSDRSHPDLFWGIRGGGGNFGVVTSFEFRTHTVGPDVTAGLVVYPQAEAVSVLRQYREFTKKAPEELTVWSVLRQAPPLPFLPEEVHGTDVLVLALCHLGASPEADIAPLKGLGTVLGEHVGVQPFVDWQKAFDPLLTPGARNYWKSHNLARLADETIDSIVEYAGKVPSPHCEVFVAQMGGATSRVAADATAYPGRDAAFIMNVHARWEAPSQDDACISWARGLFDAVAPQATGGAYINFMPADEGGRVEQAFAGNYARLTELKKQYDPDNFFRTNMNIAPRA